MAGTTNKRGYRVFSHTDQKQLVLYIAVVLVLAGLYVCHCLVVNYVADDGFIAFQYVRNLVRGEGLVYNVGERVEGYNNFLWIIMLGVCQWLVPQSSLPRIAQFLGILFGVMTIVLVCRVSRVMRRDVGLCGLLAGTFLALHAGFAAWATGGLETTLYAFLVMASAYSYIVYLKSGTNLLAVPVLFAVATLTRPDAVVLFTLTASHMLVREWKVGQGVPFGRMLLWVSVFTACYLPYYVWRFSYYGHFLPNTFYAKVGSGLYQYIRGASYLYHYAVEYGAFVFIPVLIVLCRRTREEWRDYLAFLAVGYMGYLVYVGGDGLAFFRFVIYIVPILYLLVQEGYIDLYWRASRLSFFKDRWRLNALAALCIIISFVFTFRQSVLPVVMPSGYRWYEPHSQLWFPGHGTDHSYVWFDNYFVDRLAQAGRWLDAHASPEAIVASTPAGSIAYHMNLRVIDMLGLNDVHIAHTDNMDLGKGRAGHEKGDGKYVLSRSPDYILMGNVAVLPYPLDKDLMAKKLVRKSEHEIWAEPSFHERYELVCIRLSDTGVFRYFTFFQKKGAVVVRKEKEGDNRECGEAL
jgi:arabinofuranosyltransferase